MHTIKTRLGASRIKSWITVVSEQDYKTLRDLSEWEERNKKEVKQKVIRRLKNV